MIQLMACVTLDGLIQVAAVCGEVAVVAVTAFFVVFVLSVVF